MSNSAKKRGPHYCQIKGKERKKDANSTELQLQAKITQLTAGVLGLGQHVLTIIIMHVVPNRIMALHFQLDFGASLLPNASS